MKRERPVIFRRYWSAIERPCTDRRGRPSYRWVIGYCRLTRSGAPLFPPVTRDEAYHEARAERRRASFIMDPLDPI